MSHGNVLALCGGVGGAKLAWGLAQALPPEQLTIAVNTGDDFTHLGLHISPDIDTVLYTLAGQQHREQGWGLAGDTWHCMAALEALGGDVWFRLGDRDLATHLYRTQQLAAGSTLSDITAQLCRQHGVAHKIVPMSDQAVRTCVMTDHGELPFQDYFVRHQCQPRVNAVRFAGAEQAVMSPALATALADPALRAVVICPSNPLLSIGPVLAVPGVRAALQAMRDKVWVVSPLVGGQAIKGPTAKLLQELAVPCDANGIAGFYRDCAATLVVDECDAHAPAPTGMAAQVARTLMKTDEDKTYLARQLLAIIG